MGSNVSLSASKLNIFRDCKRCFWLQMVKKIERPRGMFPSLPAGMDRLTKAYFDQYRGAMPPELVGKVPGVLWGTVAEIGKLRHWQSGMKPIIQTPHGSVSLIGALDDLSFHEGQYSPVDGKTKGSAVKPGDTEKYYAMQGDLYSLALRESGKPPSGQAHFFYLWPAGFSAQGAGCILLGFEFEVVTIEASAERGLESVCAATKLLREADPVTGPEAAKTCEYCNYHRALVPAGS